LHDSGIDRALAREAVLDKLREGLPDFNASDNDEPAEAEEEGPSEGEPREENNEEEEEDGPHLPSHFPFDRRRKKNRKTSVQLYGTDLTAKAREGKIDPIIGRDKEIQRVLQILGRRSKSNPLLLGEAGVGKTAIAEGLALAIVAGNVPDNLLDKKVISVDMAQMIAGTQYRGQFEERLKTLIDEMKASQDILFIDELHTIIGAGGSEGSMDASNILKPAIARGELQILGATTINEYRKHIEKDDALRRRFLEVMIDEPTEEQTLAILKGLQPKYEEHHKVVYTPQAIEAAVKLSQRYVNERFQPDKSIDLIDEAGSRKRVSRTTRPTAVRDLEKQIADIQNDLVQASQKSDFVLSKELKQARIAKENELKALTKNRNLDEVLQVTEEDIVTLLSEWTKIPMSRLSENEASKYLHLEDTLKERVIGQDEACVVVSKALKRSRADIRDPRRPIGSFLFLGPTGVGKTYLARNLAEQMFGTADALIQIDMSEFGEKHNVSKLIGSPAGYVGYDDQPQLTEAVRRRPYSVVLFDEVEKAHPDVMNILLQIMEEGRITDGKGRKVNFSNTIIILTSNAGASSIKRQSTVGFGSQVEDKADYDSMKKTIEESSKKYFRPELLNRFDSIVIFRMLEKDDLCRIVNIEVNKLVSRLKKAHNIELSMTKPVLELIADQGYQPEYGARPMRRAIERLVEDALAEDMISGAIVDGSRIEAVLSETGKSIKFQHLPLTDEDSPKTENEPSSEK
jgi:ATP-dependent Clp protease ATP-binding subunit ClpC